MAMFIDEYPAAIESLKRQIDSAYLDARTSQAAVPRYMALKERLSALQHEYMGFEAPTPTQEEPKP